MKCTSREPTQQGAEPVTRRDKDIDRTVTVLKFTYSLALLVFSVIIVMAAIFTKQTVWHR